MSIRKDYAKAYANYLRRVTQQESKGYHVKPIAKVKNPTRKSVARLQGQRAKQIVKRSVRQDPFNRALAKQLGEGSKKAHKPKKLTPRQRSERSRKGWTDERRKKASERMKKYWEEKKKGEDHDDPIFKSIDALWDKLEERVTGMGFSWEKAKGLETIATAVRLDDAMNDAIKDGWSQESINPVAEELERELIKLNDDPNLGWKLYYDDAGEGHYDDDVLQFVVKDAEAHGKKMHK